MNNVSRLLEKVGTLPPSPALLPKLARTLGDVDKTDVHEIVDIILFDSVLTAKLLQIANSAFFGGSSPVTSVGEAINHLGYDTVFIVAASICGESFLRTAPGSGFDVILLWKHSVTTAFSAQHIALASELDGNLAFTAGLLHDLGKLVFAETYGKSYTNMFSPTKRGSSSLVEWETDHYGCNHSDVGATLLENWKLPKPLVDAVKYHHHFSAAGENAPLAACVCLGNALSRTFENSEFALDPEAPEIEPALKFMNLTAADLAKQWGRIRKKWEFVQILCELRA